MDATVPPVEVADDAHAPRVGRPHGEVHARPHAVRHRPRAEPIEGAHVRAFGKQVLIEVGQHRTVAIRIVESRSRRRRSTCTRKR